MCPFSHDKFFATVKLQFEVARRCRPGNIDELSGSVFQVNFWDIEVCAKIVGQHTTLRLSRFDSTVISSRLA